MRRILLLLALASAAAACATAQAKQPVAVPPLEVPLVPGRVIEPMPVEAPPPPPEPVPELPPPPAPKPLRPSPPARATEKPEPKPEPPVEAGPAPVVPPPPVVPPLRTANTPDTAEFSRQIRDVLDHAGKTLNSINYQALKTGPRREYDDAKKQITLAEDKLKSGDFELAGRLAEKADKIATGLQGR